MNKERLDNILQYITGKLDDYKADYFIAKEGTDIVHDIHAAIIVSDPKDIGIINYYYNHYLNPEWEKVVKDYYNAEWSPSSTIVPVDYWKRFEKLDYGIPTDIHDPETYFLIDFSDAYTSCCDTGRLIRTSPDSYSWIPYYWLCDDAILHGDTVKEGYTYEYLADHVNRSKLLNRDIVDPFMLGWEPLDTKYSNSMFDKVSDDPLVILDKAAANNIDILFTGTPCQFRTSFEVWVKSEDLSFANLLL